MKPTDDNNDDAPERHVTTPPTEPRLEGTTAPHLRQLPRVSIDALVARASEGVDSARYTRNATLGRGSAGTVYEVWDSLLGRTLAMKVSNTRASDFQGRRWKEFARFLDEAQLTGQLQHPGIVPLYDIGVDENGFVFFTMQKIEGIELSKVLRRVSGGAVASAQIAGSRAEGERASSDRWTLNRALRALADACDAVAFAHGAGVLHRDLKPSNIMVGSFGETYVVDWGLANARWEGWASGDDQTDAQSEAQSESQPEARPETLDDDSPRRTVTGTILGTPVYMSPEQASGEINSLTAATDVYSLGACLYELIGGSPPYTDGRSSSSAHAIVDELKNGPPTPLHKLAPEAPVALVAVVERAMAREQSDRYASVAQLGDDLRAYLEDRVVKAHRTGAVAELVTWIRRNKLVATAAAAVVVLAGWAGWSEVRSAQRLAAANNNLRAAKDDTERQAHYAHLGNAQSALLSNDAPSAKRHLAKSPEALRGWYFDHLASRASFDGVVDARGAGLSKLSRSAVSADGRFGVTAIGGIERRKALITRFEDARETGATTTAETETEFKGVVAVEFIGETHTFALVDTAGAIYVCDAADSGRLIASIPFPDDKIAGKPKFVMGALSSDGRTAVVARREVGMPVSPVLVQLPGFETRALGTAGASMVRTLAVASTPPAMHLIAERGGVRGWTEATGFVDIKTEASGPRSVYAASAAIGRSARGPERSRYAAAVAAGAIALWQDFEAGSTVSLALSGDDASALQFHPRYDWLAVGLASGGVLVFDCSSREVIFRRSGHERACTSVRWSTDGSQLFSATDAGRFLRFDVGESVGVEVWRPSTTRLNTALVSADGERIACTPDGGLSFVLDARSGATVWSTLGVADRGTAQLICVPHSNDVITVTRGELWRITGDTPREVSASAPLPFQKGNQRLREFAAGGTRFTVETRAACAVIDAETLERVCFAEGRRNLKLDRAGRVAWCSSGSGVLQRINIEASDPVVEAEIKPDAQIVGMGFAPSGDVLAVAVKPGTLEFRDPVDGRLLATRANPIKGGCHFDFHPSEPLMLVSAISAQTAKAASLWDTDRWELIGELTHGGGTIRKAAFAADGATVIAQQSSGEGFVVFDRFPVKRDRLMLREEGRQLNAKIAELRKRWFLPEAISARLVGELAPESGDDAADEGALGAQTFQLRAGRSRAWHALRIGLPVLTACLQSLSHDLAAIRESPSAALDVVRALNRCDPYCHGAMSALAITTELDRLDVMRDVIDIARDEGRYDDGRLSLELAIAAFVLDRREEIDTTLSRLDLEASLEDEAIEDIKRRAHLIELAEDLLDQ